MKKLVREEWRNISMNVISEYWPYIVGWFTISLIVNFMTGTIGDILGALIVVIFAPIMCLTIIIWNTIGGRLIIKYMKWKNLWTLKVGSSTYTRQRKNK